VIDLNPSISYRITSYWLVGTGWNHRLEISRSHFGPDDKHVRGLRSYSEVILFRGLSFRLEGENFSFTNNGGASEGRTKRMVTNLNVGIKKDYKFISKINGNVQFMYNLYSNEKSNLNPSKLNIRFGFEYSLQKKKQTRSKNKSSN
jgi:hypothetical protein